MKTVKIGVVGLGYVGLPVALGFAKRFAGTVGLDIYASRGAAAPSRWGLALLALALLGTTREAWAQS